MIVQAASARAQNKQRCAAGQHWLQLRSAGQRVCGVAVGRCGVAVGRCGVAVGRCRWHAQRLGRSPPPVPATPH
jgi:hypothetical protein